MLFQACYHGRNLHILFIFSLVRDSIFPGDLVPSKKIMFLLYYFFSSWVIFVEILKSYERWNLYHTDVNTWSSLLKKPKWSCVVIHLWIKVKVGYRQMWQQPNNNIKILKMANVFNNMQVPIQYIKHLILPIDIPLYDILH